MVSSITMDFWWVSAKAGLLSRTSTPAAASVLRDSSFSFSPLRRAGFSITRTLHAALFRRNHRIDQRRIGEQEHPDVERCARRR